MNISLTGEYGMLSKSAISVAHANAGSGSLGSQALICSDTRIMANIINAPGIAASGDIPFPTH